MALLQLVDKIYIARDNDEFALGIFLHLSKAFDTVDFNILLNKVKHYGFHKITFKWLQSYVLDLKPYVSINGIVSGKQTKLTGVPQGSILGPLLFLIYDLPSACRIFADDTNLIITHSDFRSLISEANKSMEEITKWFLANKLSLNVTKTNFIVFSGNKKYCKDLCIIIINKTEITQVTKVKFLGGLVDEKINWKEHINLVCNKMARSFGVIRKISGLLNRECLLTLYFSLIYPHLTYCNIVWASKYDSYLHSIYILQKRFVRTVTHCKCLVPPSHFLNN